MPSVAAVRSWSTDTRNHLLCWQKCCCGSCSCKVSSSWCCWCWWGRRGRTRETAYGERRLTNVPQKPTRHWADIFRTPALIIVLSDEYGNTDLGATGIENWLFLHRCNAFCGSNWKNISSHPSFPVQQPWQMLPTAPAMGQEHTRVRPSTIMFTQDRIVFFSRKSHQGALLLTNFRRVVCKNGGQTG